MATAAVLLGVLSGPAAADLPACPGAGTEPATISSVAGPATLRLEDGALVRLAAVDVPAWASSSGAVALARLVPPQTAAELAPTAAAPDRYGSRHAYVFLPDGRQLQATLVEAGAARARWLPGEGACLADLLAAEDKARRAGLGIWASPQAILAADDASLVRHAGLYEIVGGRLASVGHGTQTTFLDFGRDHRRDFTVMLSAAVAKTLTGTLGSVDALVGRQLLVRGVIENNHGAAIRLNDAAEIELSDTPPKP